MTISRQDPMTDFVSLSQAMNRLMEQSFVPGWLSGEGTREAGVLRLPLDAYATDEEIVILASVPGATADDVNITFEEHTLIIEGEIQAPLENVDYVLRERPFGRFRRTLNVNTPVDIDKAEAKFESGVLTLILPKAEQARPKSIKIKST